MVLGRRRTLGKRSSHQQADSQATHSAKSEAPNSTQATPTAQDSSAEVAAVEVAAEMTEASSPVSQASQEARAWPTGFPLHLYLHLSQQQAVSAVRVAVVSAVETSL